MSNAVVFVLTCLTAYRLWRLLAVDHLPPFMWLRSRIETPVERRHGGVWAAGLRCPWCSGAWLSWAVVAAVWAVRPLPLPALWFVATSTVVGLIAQYDPAD